MVHKAFILERSAECVWQSVQGLMTLRAHRVQQAHVLKQEALLSRSLQITLPSIMTARWLAMRVELMGGVVVFMTAIISTILLPRRSPPASSWRAQ